MFNEFDIDTPYTEGYADGANQYPRDVSKYHGMKDYEADYHAGYDDGYYDSLEDDEDE